MGLTAKDDTLSDQLKNLQKYLDIKDKQLADAHNALQENEQKLKEKELKMMQEQNVSLENRVKAYFKFSNSSNNYSPDTPSTPPINNWKAQTRGRHASEYSQHKRHSSLTGTSTALDNDNLLKQQEYLADFARL